MTTRKHTVDEVIRSLTSKGCRITLDTPLTKNHKNMTLIVQHPYTVNISKANNLGNGSWGKIDYLINHQDFNLQTL